MAALPLLAEVSDLAGFLDEQIAEDDLRARAVLRMASSVVRAYVGKDWATEEIPEAAADVTMDVAARVWINPAGLVQDGIDDVTRRWSESTAPEGFYLTAANRTVLDALRTTRRGGLHTIATTRGDGDYLDTVYVPTGPPPSGYPFPWYAADDPLIQ